MMDSLIPPFYVAILLVERMFCVDGSDCCMYVEKEGKVMFILVVCTYIPLIEQETEEFA